MLSPDEHKFAIRTKYKLIKKPFPCWNDPQGFRVSEQEIKDAYQEIRRVINEQKRREQEEVR